MKNYLQLKELMLSTVVTFVMGLLILLTKLNFAYNIIVFVGVECIICYVYRNHILMKKVYLQNQCSIIQSNIGTTSETETGDSILKFNPAYYDLYNNFSFNRTMIVFKAMFLGLSFSAVVFAEQQDIILYVLCGMGVMLTCMLLVCLILFQFKNEKTLMRLLNLRKTNWYGDYTKEELEIIDELMDNKLH